MAPLVRNLMPRHSRVTAVHPQKIFDLLCHPLDLLPSELWEHRQRQHPFRQAFGLGEISLPVTEVLVDSFQVDRDWVVDARLDFARVQALPQGVAPLGLHDEQVVDVRRVACLLLEDEVAYPS